MKAEVRDDIIALESFVAARFKYEKYLNILRDAGCYCFLEQFKRHFESGEHIAKKMEKYNLINMELINNGNKFIYISDSGMRYLKYKDDERDFTNIAKNKLSVRKVTKYPSGKVLLSSALKFGLIADGKNKIVIKEHLLEFTKKNYCPILSVDASSGQLDEEYEKDLKRYEILKSKVLNLYDKSKIILAATKEKMQFCILDTGNTKSAFGYFKIINELRGEILPYISKIDIIIFSYSEKRAINLKNEFESVSKEKEKYENIMKSYEKNAGVKRYNRAAWGYEPPEFYKEAEKLFNSTPDVNIFTIDKTWYMEKYMKNISMSDSYIKPKDREAIKNLKKKLGGDSNGAKGM